MAVITLVVEMDSEKFPDLSSEYHFSYGFAHALVEQIASCSAVKSLLPLVSNGYIHWKGHRGKTDQIELEGVRPFISNDLSVRAKTVIALRGPGTAPEPVGLSRSENKSKTSEKQ